MKRLLHLPSCLILLWLGTSGAFAGQSPTAPSTPIVVQPESLPGMLDGASRTPGLVLLDGRSLNDFQTRHVSGALWVNISEWKAASLKAGVFPSPASWRERLSTLGIGGNSPVVVYDDGNMSDAARLWFLLQLLGVKNAGVVNGGFPELAPLIDSGKINVVTGRSDTDHRKVETDSVAPSACRVNFADKDTVRKAIDSKSAVILDVRSEAEYAGTDQEKNPRHGHLPNAINLPHYRLLDTKDNPPTLKSKGRLKSPVELRRIFEQAGLTTQNPVITHCQSGGRASLAALALIHAGYGQVANYYPSFADWAADAQAPLTQPPRTSAAKD